MNDTIPGERERLTADETEKFMAVDVNGDGLLDKDEFPALLAPESNEQMLKVTTKHALRDADTDKNGRLSFEEFKTIFILDEISPSMGKR